MTKLFRFALALYPAAYRRERGGELAAVFGQTTAGAGRLTVAREVLDLAAYGLRLRTGLTFGGMTGRVLAAAAPLMLGMQAGVMLLAVLLDHDYPGMPPQLRYGVTGCSLLALVAGPAGRWAVARLAVGLMAAGALLRYGFLMIWIGEHASFFRPGWALLDLTWVAVAPVLWAVLLWLVPADLRAGASWGQALAAAAGLLLAGAMYVGWDFYNPGYPGRGVLVIVLLLALLLTGVGAGVPRVAAVAVATLPYAVQQCAFDAVSLAGGAGRLAVVLLLVGSAVVLACRYLTRRRERVSTG